MSSLNLTCKVMFGRYPWECCSFLKEDRGEVDLVKRGGARGTGSSEVMVNAIRI